MHKKYYSLVGYILNLDTSEHVIILQSECSVATQKNQTLHGFQSSPYVGYNVPQNQGTQLVS